MGRTVKLERLQKRRRYRGFIYQRGDQKARAAEFTGAEWRQMITLDGARIETIDGDQGALQVKVKAAILYEIFEDAPSSAPEQGALAC